MLAVANRENKSFKQKQQHILLKLEFDILYLFVDQSSIHLQVLDLGNNQFTSIDLRSFHALESLVHLDLSDNSIVEIDDGAFSALSRLTRLDLRDNRLTRLTALTFRGLTSLRYLLLTNNRIQTIDRRAFRALEGLVYVVLKGNPIGSQPVRFQVFCYSSLHRNIIFEFKPFYTLCFKNYFIFSLTITLLVLNRF